MKHQIKLINEDTNEIKQIYYVERDTMDEIYKHCELIEKYLSSNFYLETSQI